MRGVSARLDGLQEGQDRLAAALLGGDRSVQSP